MDTPQTVIVDVCIDLGGFDIGVAEHLLKRPQVGSAGEQVGGETVPQGVDGQVFRHPGSQSVFFHNAPQFDPVQWPAGP
jgi:hypothetical protein